MKSMAHENPDTHEIATILVEKFNALVEQIPQLSALHQIGDQEGLADLLDTYFDAEALDAFLYHDFTQGIIFGYLAAMEVMKDEGDDGSYI